MRSCEKLAMNAHMFTHVVHINTDAIKATYRAASLQKKPREQESVQKVWRPSALVPLEGKQEDRATRTLVGSPGQDPGRSAVFREVLEDPATPLPQPVRSSRLTARRAGGSQVGSSMVTRTASSN